MNEPRIKSLAEIQQAHDILHPLFHGETEVVLPAEQRQVLGQTLGVLCWVLGHDEGESFQRLLDGTISVMRRAGYELTYDPERQV